MSFKNVLKKIGSLRSAMMVGVAVASVTSFAGNEPSGGGSGGGTTCPTTTNNCISFFFSVGPMRNHVEAPNASIGLMSDYSSPTHSTPQALKVIVGAYSMDRVKGNTVYMRTGGGQPLEFVFTDGDAVGIPTGFNSLTKARLIKVDAAGDPITSGDPVYYDLYTYNELERYRFDADPESATYTIQVQYRTKSGRTEDVSDYGLDLVYVDGVIRQAKGPTRLLDFVVDTAYKYEVRYYLIDDVGPKDTTTGIYPILQDAPAFETWIVENPDKADAYNLMDVSREVGGTVRTHQFKYISAQRMWQSSKDAWNTRDETTFVKSGNTITKLQQFITAGEDPCKKMVKTLADYGWGMVNAETEYWVSMASPPLKDVWTYYDNEAEAGRYGRIRSVKRKDGSWSHYDYDDWGRKTLEVTSWLDVPYTENAAQAKAITFSYDTNDKSVDTPIANDHRVRVRTESILGTVTKKTYTTYKTINDALVVEAQECLDNGAGYNDPANLKTIETYYLIKPDENDMTDAEQLVAGRLKSVQYPDGTMKEYIYERGTLTMNYDDPELSSFNENDAAGLDWRVTTSKGVADTNGDLVQVANESMIEVKVKDEFSNVALRETYVYTGSTTDPEQIDWTVGKFDVYGHATETHYADGTFREGYWGTTACCGMDSGTDRDGVTTTYGYDAYLRRKSATSQKWDAESQSWVNSVTVSYTYDAAGRRTSQTRSYDPESKNEDLVSGTLYDMLGRAVAITNEAGLVTHVNYNDATQTVTTTHPSKIGEERTKVVQRYLDGQTKSISGTAAVAMFYGYDVNKDVTDPDGTLSITTHTGSSDNSSERTVTEKTDLLGRVWKVEKPGYNGFLLTTEYTYDAGGRVLSETKSDNESGSVPLVKRWKYCACGDVEMEGIDVDRDGTLDKGEQDRITEHETKFLNGKKISKTYTYPTAGLSSRILLRQSELVLTGNGLGGTETGYDGKLIAKQLVTDQFGKTTTRKTYLDRAARKKTVVVTSGRSAQPQETVTINGLVQSKVSTTGVEGSIEYDDFERQFLVSSDSDAQGDGTDERTVSMTYHYNVKGQLEYTLDEVNNRTDYAYYPDTGLKYSETKTVIGKDPIITYYAYDLHGRKTKEWGATYPVEYGFDAYGQLHTLKTWRNAVDGQGGSGADSDVTTWNYEPATGFLTSKVYDDEKGPAYTYYPDGKQKRRTWFRQNKTVYADYTYYDEGELKKIDYSDATTDISYTYYRSGQQHTVTDDAGTRTFVYGLQDQHKESLQLIGETLDGDNGYTLTRTYDDYGRSTGYGLVPPASSGLIPQSVVYGYDAKGRFETVSSTVNGAQTISETFTYEWMDGANLLNGYSTAGVSPALSVTYGYEPNRNLKTLVNNQTVNSAPVSKYEYTYDEIGRREDREDTIGAADPVLNQFGYNTRSEVTSAFGKTYDYDDIGNRRTATEPDSGTPPASVTTTYAANELNQYKHDGTVPGAIDHDFDDDGNLENDGTWIYRWNGENRLKEMEAVNQVAGAKKLEFKYDYMGRRIKKTVHTHDGSDFQRSATHKFIYDGWNLIAETEFNQQSEIVNQKSYVWGLDLSLTTQGAGGVGGLLAQISDDETTSSIYYSATDANGNITDYVNASGNVVAQYTYDAFGKVNSEIGSHKSDFDIRFSSKYEDYETDLSYYGLRFYISEIGRWLNRDPILERGGLNIYSCGNRMLNVVDLLGLSESDYVDTPADILLPIINDSVPVPGDGNVLTLIKKWIRGDSCTGGVQEETKTRNYNCTRRCRERAVGTVNNLTGTSAFKESRKCVNNKWVEQPLVEVKACTAAKCSSLGSCWYETSVTSKAYK